LFHSRQTYTGIAPSEEHGPKWSSQDRIGEKCIPEGGVIGTYKRLQRPTLEEGFDELFSVEIMEATREFVLHQI
jgi:hypothetical protein